MHMLYNSDSFVVVQFEVPAPTDGKSAPSADALVRGGFEIVDKNARRETYIEGAVAEGFKLGVEALVDRGSSPEDFDAFIAGYTLLAQQPVTLH